MNAAARVNILLVDDQPSKLLTYEAILAELGENLIKATSASEALQHLLREEIAVVLVDVCMPELDGYELASMIREHPRYQQTSIIFVSAILMTDLDRLRGYECGAVDYVPVPVVPEILRAKVSVFADLYRKTRQLERMNDELEARVSARTAELEATAARLRENEARLQEADRRKDEFLAILAHELRNPLAPIRTGVQLMRLKQLPEPQRDRARDIISRQVDHMVRLIDDLIDVSRISRGMITLQREEVELGVVIGKAIETVRPVVKERRHALKVSLPDSSITLIGDEARLAQAISNLLHNAAKYTEPGGRLDLEVTAGQGDIVIRVRDNGVGLAPDDIPRLFEPFTQVGTQDKRQRTGLGIGLALVRRLVEMHGGRVDVTSEGPGRGCEFVVRLPLESTVAAVTAQPDDSLMKLVSGSAAGQRVVVVDDNADAAEAMAMLLVAAGHDVRVAHDGVEALSVCETFQPDTIFLDLGMPRMNGWETAERLRKEPWGQPLLLVALTGWGQAHDRDRTAAAGFDAHLVKPVGEAELTRVMNGESSRRPDARRLRRES